MMFVFCFEAILIILGNSSWITISVILVYITLYDATFALLRVPKD